MWVCLLLSELWEMSKSYQELLAERKALDRQIAEAQKSEKADAIREVRELIKVFGFSMSEVGAGSGRTNSKSRPKTVTRERRPGKA